MLSFFRRFLVLTLVAGTLGMVFYVRSDTFSRRWCAFVVEQLEKRNLFISLENLTLDPFEGLVARGLKVFHDPERHQLLGELDRLNLDLDYGKMLRHELFIESVDLRDADVRFPVDEEDPKSEILQMDDMNARLLVVGDRIEIRQAESTLFGLRIHMSGSVLKPRHVPREETEEEKQERKRQRLAAIRARRDLIVQVARGLRHFESAHAPTLEVEVNGDLEEPEELSISMNLSANGLRHRDYVCEELSATATYARETVDISRLHVRDHLGELEASATWRLGAQHIDLQVQSSADLPGFVSAILQRNEKLREVVFYEPPDLQAEGRLLLGKAVPEGALFPFEGVANIKAGRFASRGEMIESLEANVGLSAEGCYIRDGLLTHKSGTTTFQAMWRKGAGLKYRALVQMDPRVLLPFAQTQPTRETLQRFGLDEHSSFYLQIEGEGEELNLQECRSTGTYDLRNFTYRGTDIQHLTGKLETKGRVHNFTDLHLTRSEGEARADKITHDIADQKVTFNNVRGAVYIDEIVHCFAPKIATIIERYQLNKAPEVAMQGFVFYRKPGTDLTVKFNSPGGSGVYPLKEENHVISDPAGTLVFRDNKLSFDVTGRFHDGPMECKGVTSLKPEEKNYSVKFTAANFPHPIFGKPAPFRKVTADIDCKDGDMAFDVHASLFEGAFTTKGRVNQRVEPQPYEGELTINALSFKQFASLYSPNNETLGDVTGHFKFTGEMNDWRALRGEGALTILNANLYSVPILGPLTPLIGAVLPRPIKGYNEAKDADCTFVVENGFATTKNIEATTAVFRLISKGSIDFLENRILFEAQVRLRGLPGLVFFPVSEILEYVGEGSVGQPNWRPRYFSTTQEKEEFRKLNEAPLSQAELEEMEDAEESSGTKPRVVAVPAQRQPAARPRVSNPSKTGKPKDDAEEADAKKPATGAARFSQPGSPIRLGK